MQEFFPAEIQPLELASIEPNICSVDIGKNKVTQGTKHSSCILVSRKKKREKKCFEEEEKNSALQKLKYNVLKKQV